MFGSENGTRKWVKFAVGVTAATFASAAMADDPIRGWTRSFTDANHIDTSGRIVYAVNVTPDANDMFEVGDLMFTSSENTAGFRVDSMFSRDQWLARPELGNAGLEDVMWDMRFSNHNHSVKLDANVNPNRVYKIQLLFSDAYWNEAGNRAFDIYVEDQLVVNEFDIIEVAGPHNGHVESGALYTWTVAATDGQINVELRHGSTTFDTNPLINAMTVELVPAPATIGLMGLGGLMISRRRRRSA